MMSGSAPTPAPSTSIADIQLHIRRNAEEYRQVLDDLADWESQIKAAPASSQPLASSSARPLPPVRGSSAKPSSSPATAEPVIPKTKTPRDYAAWDKIDVDSLLQELENQDYAQYHSALPAPTTTTTQRNPQLALIEKDTGNVYFKKSKFQKALKHYSKAIELDPLNPVLFLNRAAAFLKLDPPIHSEAAEDCTRALELDHGKNVKALFRRAMAKKLGGDVGGAVEDLKRAQVLEPTNMEVKRELLVLEPPKPAAAVVEAASPPQVKVSKRRKLVVREFSSALVDQVEPVGVESNGAQEEEALMTAVKTTTLSIAHDPEDLPANRQRARSRQATTSDDTPMPDVPLMLASLPPPEPAPEVTAATVQPEPAAAGAPIVQTKTTPTHDPAPLPSPAPTQSIPASLPSLPVPQAAYEFSMAMSHLTRHAHLPPLRHTAGVVLSSVSDMARAYLLAILPNHLMGLFATAGVDTEVLAWVVLILRSMPPATDVKSAALKYNYLHYLSQCARFGVARRLLAKVYADMVAEVVGEIRAVFVKEGKVDAVDKVDKVRGVWGV